MTKSLDETWFTIEYMEECDNESELFCIAVDSPDKQFLAGKLGIPTHNTDEGKAINEMKGEARLLLASIARLGRAAGVHLVLAMQRPDATILSGEVKANLGVRIGCGTLLGSASSMILENGEGGRIRSNPKGRVYVKIYNNGNHGQGFYAETGWVDRYLEEKGLNPDGTPLEVKRSRLAVVNNLAELEDTTLDEQSGIDNMKEIERIRIEEQGDEILEGDDYNAPLFRDDEEVDENLNSTSGTEDLHKLLGEFIEASADDAVKQRDFEADWDDIMDEIIKANKKQQ